MNKKNRAVRSSLATTTIHVETAGDRSVGVWPDDINITWNLILEPDDPFREDIRGELQRAFSNCCGEKATVRFGDECPECGERLAPAKQGKKTVLQCVNPNCISNMHGLD